MVVSNTPIAVANCPHVPAWRDEPAPEYIVQQFRVQTLLVEVHAPCHPLRINRSRPLLSAISSRGSASVGPDSVFGLKGRRKLQHLSMNARDHDVFDDISGRRGSKFDPSSRGRSHSRSTVSSLPVHDKPILDDYEDEGGYDDVFVMKKVRGNRHFDDILAGFRIKDDDSKSRERIARAAGYAGSVQSKGSPYTNNIEAIHSPQTTANADEQRGETFAASGPSPSHRSASSSGLSADLLEAVNMSGKSKSLKANGFSASSEGIYDNWKDIDRNRKSMTSFVSEKYSMGKERSPLKCEHSTGRPTSSPHEKVNFKTSQPRAATSRLSAVNAKLSDDVWLTVSEIPLITQPTKGPPPSRPPPPLPAQVLRGKGELFGLSKEKKKFNGSLAGNPVLSAVKARVSSSFDHLRNLSMSRSSHDFEDLPSGFPREEPRRNSDAAASAAAMKVAIDRVEAKFWHANESEGSEVARSSRSRGSKRLDKIECSNDSSGQVIDEKERFEREWPQRQTRAAEKEREDKEQRRLEKENERSKQIERERQAVKRVTREACELAAIEARLKAEKAAIEKAHAETRDRVERAAVQRALTEARQRAANEARVTVAKAATEVQDRDAFGKSYEAWIGAERAAAEAKGRDANEVRQMATSSAASFSKDNPATSENGLDSIFKKSSQASSSRTRENSMGPAFDSKPQSRQGPDVVKTTVPSFSSLRQVPSSAAMADNLASILGVAPSGEFQEIEGEAEERRNARMERHQRTQERAAKALAEKNHRDMQIQREQEERHRIAETMDIEIKRWAAGKEGNLRALLSTLQYVLWPECGWQPVSLTALINTASVRKAYRKATLCIHPDKVQQRGANLQQKYIAEKIFDLLKEAWNKLNSEELF